MDYQYEDEYPYTEYSPASWLAPAGGESGLVDIPREYPPQPAPSLSISMLYSNPQQPPTSQLPIYPVLVPQAPVAVSFIIPSSSIVSNPLSGPQFPHAYPDSTFKHPALSIRRRVYPQHKRVDRKIIGLAARSEDEKLPSCSVQRLRALKAAQEIEDAKQRRGGKSSTRSGKPKSHESVSSYQPSLDSLVPQTSSGSISHSNNSYLDHYSLSMGEAVAGPSLTIQTQYPVTPWDFHSVAEALPESGFNAIAPNIPAAVQESQACSSAPKKQAAPPPSVYTVRRRPGKRAVGSRSHSPGQF